MDEKVEKLALLKENISYQIGQVNTRRVYYQHKAFLIFMATTILSGITTIILGVNIELLKDYFRIAALILTTCVTVANAYNTFYGHKELWVANNMAQNRLYELQFNITYAEAGNSQISVEQMEQFRKTYQDILNEVNSSWQKNRTPDKS